jgi:hypothetical protein
MVNAFLAVCPSDPASTVNGPPLLTFVGVPEMRPDDDMLSPGGRLPLTSDQMYWSSPPDAENLKEYALPTVALGGDANVLGVVMVSAACGSDQMENDFSEDCPSELTFTVKGPPLLTELGDPAMRPADDMDRPGGRLPLTSDHE